MLAKLLSKARKNSGFSDFGDEFFIDPLKKLIASINQEASLNAFGNYITRVRLDGLLQNRLRAQHWFKKHPEILEIELAPPLMITGLQRTGTTMLQRLLSADQNFRSLLSWESLNPAPYEGYPKNEPRIAQALKSEKGLKYIAPDFFAIHPVQHQLPEEEVLLLDMSFLSTVAEATLNVPSFGLWLEKQDQTPAYNYMVKLLKLLHWQRPGKKWVLKSPHHLEYLQVVCKVFPGIKIVQTHRDPITTMASFCSMLYHGRQIFSDHNDPNVVGKQWSRKVGIMVNNGINFRQSERDSRYLDLGYKDLISDPLKEVQKIYEFIDWELDPDLKTKMETSLHDNQQHKYGIHHYQLSDFGLDESSLSPLFEDYKTRFKKYI